MSKNYFLTKDAEIDLENIILYTYKEFGIDQVHKYKNQFISRIAAIVKFPDIDNKYPKLDQ
jgi:plasmid stabilization system protein ParE